jgi:hypothetical protein
MIHELISQDIQLYFNVYIKRLVFPQFLLDPMMSF